jgi:hypothetical protein
VQAAEGIDTDSLIDPTRACIKLKVKTGDAQVMDDILRVNAKKGIKSTDSTQKRVIVGKKY